MTLVLLKLALVVFLAGNLLDLGLQLNLREALRGLGNVRFVAYTLLWGFVLVPALAVGIPRVIPLDPAYATGLVLLGMTPCAPFLPAMVARAKGDMGFTAAFMFITAVGTVLFMPVAVPLLVKGLTVSTWAIARPLLVLILLPLAAGMVVRQAWPAAASTAQPIVKRVTGLSAIATVVLCIIVYGKGLLGVAGQLAIASQLVFFAVVAAGTCWCAFGLRHEQRIVLSTGMTTRNVGAAIAPLLSAPGIDPRATIMVVLGLPMMVLVAWLALKWSSHRAGAGAADPAASGESEH